ncbi:hypothetical protein CPC08DRAFT_715752 [Agrocybe pediades]|nr:hypothetical protein CPC08DRAFT_715752 [Agrocybe pediades]
MSQPVVGQRMSYVPRLCFASATALWGMPYAFALPLPLLTAVRSMPDAFALPRLCLTRLCLTPPCLCLTLALPALPLPYLALPFAFASAHPAMGLPCVLAVLCINSISNTDSSLLSQVLFTEEKGFGSLFFIRFRFLVRPVVPLHAGSNFLSAFI